MLYHYVREREGAATKKYKSEIFEIRKQEFNARYKEIKRMIKDPITRETLLYAKPKSKKIKIMLLPIKLKLTLLTMLMGRMFNLVKTKFPSLF